jgi:hypothetical protein
VIILQIRDIVIVRNNKIKLHLYIIWSHEMLNRYRVNFSRGTKMIHRRC